MVKDEDSSVEYKLHCTNNSRTKQFREHQFTRFDAGDSGGAELSDTKLMAYGTFIYGPNGQDQAQEEVLTSQTSFMMKTSITFDLTVGSG